MGPAQIIAEGADPGPPWIDTPARWTFCTALFFCIHKLRVPTGHW